MAETRKLAALAVDVARYSELAGADEERTLARLRRSEPYPIRSQWPKSERARDGSARRAKMLVVAGARM